MGVLPKPCLDCGTLTPNTRCHTCHQASRKHYKGDYAQRSRQVRDTATHCWICGQPAKPNDPWTADHYYPGDPTSPLLPAHKSCNSRRQDTPPPPH